MIPVFLPYIFLLGLALVPIQVLMMVRKAVKRDRFSDQILQALTIDRLKGATQDSQGGRAPEAREYYPVPPREWEQALLPVQQKDSNPKRIFFFGFVTAIALMQLLGLLYI